MDPMGQIWQVALALVVIIAVVLLLGFIAKRFQGYKSSSGKLLSVVETTLLGPKERLVLVRVAKYHVLVAINPQCITKLAEYQVDVDFAEVLSDVQRGDSV